MKNSRVRLLLALILASVSLVACHQKPAPQAPKSAAQRPEQDFAQYGNTILEANKGDIERVGPTYQTLESPLTYLTLFTVSNPAMLTRPLADEPEKVRASNLAITARWQRLYCTVQLQVLMRRHKVVMAIGGVVDSKGARHSTAICVVNE